MQIFNGNSLCIDNNVSFKCCCPVCGGSGHKHFIALNIVDYTTLEVSQEEFEELPYDELAAERAGAEYCQTDTDTCSLCDGTGEVYESDLRDYYYSN